MKPDGTTQQEVAYQSVERFEVGGIGDRSTGIRMTFRQATRTIHSTGVFLRRGALTGAVLLHEYTGRDARSELIDLAK